MKIRAIYLHDLAYDPKKGNLIFEYDKETKYFHMCIDKNYKYDVDSIIEDSNWLVFETELLENNNLEVGNVKQLSKDELLKKIKEG